MCAKTNSSHKSLHNSRYDAMILMLYYLFLPLYCIYFFYFLSPITCPPLFFFFFFLNDPPPPEFSPLPLHDALPISSDALCNFSDYTRLSPAQRVSFLPIDQGGASSPGQPERRDAVFLVAPGAKPPAHPGTRLR